MPALKIQTGYGSGKPLSQKKGLYGSRSSGKVLFNGGFNNCPTVDFVGIPQENWDKAFPNGYKPSWEKRKDNED